MNFTKPTYLFIVLLIVFSCNQKNDSKNLPLTALAYSTNILNYHESPIHATDKKGLMFSDQGAWFAYSLPDSTATFNGFSGPFLLTEQNGIWAGKSLAILNLKDKNGGKILFKNTSQHSDASHLEQAFKNKQLTIRQQLVFLSGNTALQKISIRNISKKEITIDAAISGKLFPVGLNLQVNKQAIVLRSKKSTAIGYIQFLNEAVKIISDNSQYKAAFKKIILQANTSKEIVVSQSFIFPKYSWKKERKLISQSNFDSVLSARKVKKNEQITALTEQRTPIFKGKQYAELLAKSVLTLQNNWRIAAGEIKHEGLFPSYHYKWFNGFWSWDSWKHAAGLSYYNTNLAKNQVKALFDFQEKDGFVPDCIFRDTLVEKHNYRDTKPPLAAWAVYKIYKKNKDINFIKELYPKLKKYHYWWYKKRDHDGDGLCEYGSTDGSLIAAKWESGMDNAIRFDNSKILKNSEDAYSLNQESVDLNAYLYAEKNYLANLAKVLNLQNDAEQFTKEASALKATIQKQFYDPIDGWFYDTSLDGKTFIKGAGSEGWTALWAKAATQKQAETVKNKMMNPTKFFTKIPFQTMSADHPKFNPLKGYWRGPNWLDQAYFGVKGLRNYGFNKEADRAALQIVNGAEGLLKKGKSIRENYHPLTGKGLNAKNFSWSAAHIIMLLQNE